MSGTFEYSPVGACRKCHHPQMTHLLHIAAGSAVEWDYYQCPQCGSFEGYMETFFFAGFSPPPGRSEREPRDDS